MALLLVLGGAMTTVQANAQPQGARPDFSKLCAGKALNSKVTAKMGDRTMQGTCQMGFKATKMDELPRGSQREPAVQNACKGKAKGQAVQVKVANKTVKGQCEIQFRPDRRN